jgi:sortase A
MNEFPSDLQARALIVESEHDPAHEITAPVVVFADTAPNGPPGTRTDRPASRAARVASASMVGFGALLLGFLLFTFVLSGFIEARGQAGLERGVAVRLTDARAAIGGVVKAGTPVARLDIPAIGVHQVVVEGTSSDQLRKGPGHLPTSPMPGQVGNVVLAGHRLAWGAPFRNLSRLHGGDVIHLVTGQGSFTYRVKGRPEVRPASVISPLQATTDNLLTLLTSANLESSKRLVVIAELLGKPLPAPAGRPSVVRSLDDGLTAQHSALPALLFYVAVLLLCVVASIWGYRHYPRTTMYLITTPVLLAAVWLVYLNLGRLLPSTF